MKVLTNTVARLLFAIVILAFGFMHFTSAGQLKGIVPIPGGVFWVYLTGAGHVLAAVSFIIKKQTKLAGILLGVMLVIFALAVHLPGFLGGNQQEMGQVLKDLAMAAAAFNFAGTIEKNSLES